MAVLFPVFKKISTLFSIAAVLVCIPTNSVRGFPFLHTQTLHTSCRIPVCISSPKFPLISHIQLLHSPTPTLECLILSSLLLLLPGAPQLLSRTLRACICTCFSLCLEHLFPADLNGLLPIALRWLLKCSFSVPRTLSKSTLYHKPTSPCLLSLSTYQPECKLREGTDLTVFVS